MDCGQGIVRLAWQARVPNGNRLGGAINPEPNHLDGAVKANAPMTE